ncbi:hypothetical protein Acr_10g0009440 [Actinidia rufa]|uniref:Reverse transcriptase domain-containing protein n=1 Tax=Actinidia rufa TaxID=165716 RepID=A0A7J0FBK6_9ERIC|nr:hypothetical protein Acr_10g0009440 [Actinidia rufa]
MRSHLYLDSSPNPPDRGKISPTFSASELAQSRILRKLSIARFSPPRHLRLRDNLQMAISPTKSPTSPGYTYILSRPFGAFCGNDSSQPSMHMRSRCLPKLSANSPLDKRARPMTNTSQGPDLEGLYREIHGAKPKEGSVGCLVIPDVKEGRLHRNPAKLQVLRTKRLGEEDPLAEVIKPSNGICPPLKRSEIWTPASMQQHGADKYIAVEGLAEAKHRRRKKDDHKRKEPGMRRSEYREQIRSKRRYGANRPTTRDIQVIHGGFGSGGYSSSSRKRHARNANGRADEEVYNLSSSTIDILPPITFNNDDLRGLHFPHDVALVVSAVIANFNVQRILVDNGSSADILFISAFDKMKIGLDKLHPFHTPLIRFGGNTIHPLGWIKLPITLGTEPHQTTIWQDFIVVDCPSPYNAILGRPTLGRIRAITSTYHLKMKFPTSMGVGEMRGDQKKPDNASSQP